MEIHNIISLAPFLTLAMLIVFYEQFISLTTVYTKFNYDSPHLEINSKQTDHYLIHSNCTQQNNNESHRTWQGVVSKHARVALSLAHSLTRTTATDRGPRHTDWRLAECGPRAAASVSMRVCRSRYVRKETLFTRL